MKSLLRTTLAAAVLLSSTSLASAQQSQDDQHRHEQQRHEEQRPAQRAPEQRHEEQRAPERHYRSVEEHDGWRRGSEMRRDDWDHGRHFDYREYGLRQPPYGYEWREVNGVFVLGAIATGIILDMMLLNGR
jgi:Ni/Co efflux regulator RcnB